jgi:hypothetical protein
MPNRTPSDAARAADPNAPIGSASMDKDRTIYLQLRAEGPNGELGDAMFTYRPVGGLAPGESKPVPPWPEP